MEEELDIGLANLSRRSESSTASPPRKRFGRRPGTIVIVEEKFSLGSGLSPLKSPSSPNLLKDFPLTASPHTPRKLSRSNTLPRLQLSKTDELDGLSMEPVKVLRLRRWIHALVIVNFDLEYGPKITKMFPPLNLSPAEAENIAFSSFPDAPQIELGSQMHSFRVRPHDPTEDKLVRNEDRPATQDGFMYGFSHFTQRRDPSSKRGYQQSSLVILTPHPYPTLFYTVLSYLGQSFLMHGGPILEVACHNIASWSDPVPGAGIELGFLGFVFAAELPSSMDTPQSATSVSVKEYDQDTKILASLSPPHPALISIFESCLQHMWSIWECLVLCEPILVYGTSAAMTSQAVWFLRDILRPIPLTGDFRPFFTIHDADHTLFINTRTPQPGVILGVTNPIIERTCKHWPHVISLGAPPKSVLGRIISCLLHLLIVTLAFLFVVHCRKEKHGSLTPRTPRTPWTPADSPMTAGPAPGWKSKTHKRYISRDRALLKRIEDACKSGDEKASTLFRSWHVHANSNTVKSNILIRDLPPLLRLRELVTDSSPRPPVLPQSSNELRIKHTNVLRESQPRRHPPTDANPRPIASPFRLESEVAARDAAEAVQHEHVPRVAVVIACGDTVAVQELGEATGVLRAVVEVEGVWGVVGAAGGGGEEGVGGEERSG
ncbi:hypothetical protein EUX98_g952 [Antrodiella citrinella]|uniref:UDENN domain-containing protein n=1 Tax=Antrodiella citrinella TaxID=2447956 RepID=A0A4S4N2N5_9APHY|nr:hypothetical protein EUX98_g952 [Antrodiella citrinella]